MQKNRLKIQEEFSLSNITLFFMAVGFLWGLTMGMGIITFATVMAGVFFGNGITGLREGRIFPLFTDGRPWSEIEYIHRTAKPFSYWLCIVGHFVLAGIVAIYCLREFH